MQRAERLVCTQTWQAAFRQDTNEERDQWLNFGEVNGINGENASAQKKKIYLSSGFVEVIVSFTKCLLSTI